MTQLTQSLQQKGLKLGVKKAYGDTFDRLRANLRRVQALTGEIQTMLAATFRQLNAEYGFSLQAPAEPQMQAYLNDLDQVERSHLQYLGIGNAFRLAQPEFADRLVRALSTRLRSVHETALGDVELWSKSAAAQLDAQLRERRRNFSRRIEAIDRIQQAAGGLDERIAKSRCRSHARPARYQAAGADRLPDPVARTHAPARRPRASSELGLTRSCRRMAIDWPRAGGALAESHGRNDLPWQNTQRSLPGLAVRDHAAADAGGHGAGLLCALPGTLSRCARAGGGARWTMCWACGAAWVTTAVRAICTLRQAGGAAAWRRVSTHAPSTCRPCRASAAPPRRRLPPSVLASGWPSWMATSNGC